MKDLSAFIKQQQELKIKTIQNTNSILRMQIGIQILLGLILVAWILTTWLLFDMLLGQIVGTISSMIVLIMISMRVILISKGGGVHLHYIYSGDADKLSRIYDTNIEIKVFTGGSSLRRKLTKCNNLQIATISSGLPLKGEDKMVNFKSVQNEKDKPQKSGMFPP